MFSVCVTSSQLVDEFPHVFSEEFGTLRGETVKLYVDKNAVSQFHKARPVPYVIKDKIEQEHEQSPNGQRQSFPLERELE